MTTLASDTFTRANAGTWGTSSGGQTWTAPRGSGSYSIASNEGVNSANGGTFSVARIGSGTATNTEVLVRCNPADTTSDIGTVARFVDSNNFYYGVFEAGKVVIGKNVSGTFTTLTSTAFTYANGTFFWLRFNLVGTALKLKAWQSGTAEPGSFTISVTDSSLSSGGYGLGSDAAGSTSFDSLTVTDASVALSVTIAGTGVLSATMSAQTALADTLAGAGTLSATMSAQTALSCTLAGTGTLSATSTLTTSMSATLSGVGTLTGTLSTSSSVSLSGTLAGSSTLSGSLSLQTSLSGSFAGSGMLLATIVATTSLGSTLAGNGSISGSFSLATMLSALFAGVGLISRAQLSLLFPFQVPGIATLSDSLHGAASIQDVLLDQTTAVDVTVGSVVLSDQA